MKLTTIDIKALQETVHHWEKDILSRLLRGDVIRRGQRGEICWQDGEPVKCYAEYSAVCKASVDRVGRLNCSRCPYYRYHAEQCDDQGSRWDCFMRDPGIETCAEMIAGLKEVLAPLVQSTLGNKLSCN